MAPRADRFDRLALERALDRLAAARRAIAAQAMMTTPKSTVEGQESHLAAWAASRGPDLARLREQINDVAGSGLTLSKVMVAAGLLGDVAGA